MEQTKKKSRKRTKGMVPRDFLCIARHLTGERQQYCVRNVLSFEEALAELKFQVRDVTTVLWVVKG